MRTCVTTCPSALQYRDFSTRTCVSACPTGTFLNSVNNTCVNVCPTAPTLYVTQGTACVLPAACTSGLVDY